MNDSPQTLLVVDDTPQNIDVLAGILRPQYKVRAATSGDKALAIAGSDSPPDLILLDVMMPGMNGYEVCTRLKADPRTRHIPVIFVTALSEIDDEAQGFAVGAVDYITKPVSPAIVEARVRTHLALHQQERELWRQVREQTAQIHSTRLAIIKTLGKAAEYKDDQTGHHVVRMAHYSRLLGEASGMDAAAVDLLFNAAPMHDVGKIGIPDQILKKPGKLDADEWAIMQTHVEIGGLILSEYQDSELLQLAREIALTHHEKWNGKGYPAGSAGEAIPLCGRIVALADVFDALTSERPYKKAWPTQQAVDLIVSEAGQHFDPKLVELFVPLVPQFEAIRERYGDTAADA